MMDAWWLLVFGFNPLGGEMTVPTNSTTAHKALAAGIGGILITVIPILQAIGVYLPEPWPAIVTGLVAILTVTGVYRVKNQPRP